MNNNLLIEIGTEEMPARFIDNAVKQLAEKIEKWLKEAIISYESINLYSTPRRLAVKVNNIADKQEDSIEEAKGPSIKIAKDDQGNWTKAAQGFARGQGVNLEELYTKTIKDVEYIFVKKQFIGENVSNILPNALTEIIKSMNFPKNMRWGTQELRYIRPIHWIVAILNDELVPLEIADVKSDYKTYGHRFLGNEAVINNLNEYENILKEQYVIVNKEERKEIILDQIRTLEIENNWSISNDEGLLNEVTNLVEFPTVLFGGFDEDYLELPREVLVTTMKEHQKYFSVEDKEGNLLPYFITVRNGTDDSIDIVRKGNEKVLRARLADARFFYIEDQKLKIHDALSKLEHVVFQEELGTIGDKVRRIKEIANLLAEHLKLDKKTINHINRTAEICKFDLVTNMVYEFPELQGLMGEKYARFLGEDDEVAKGIYEHYLPRFSGDDLPTSEVGQIVSIADKIDNIVGSFSLGRIPTGSQDPLGLRRQAAGIVQIILDLLPELELIKIFNVAIDSYDTKGLLKRGKDELIIELLDFFNLRIKNILQEKSIRYDIIDALLSINHKNIYSLVQKAEILNNEVNQPNFKDTIDSFIRVINISKKANNSYVNPELFEQEVESYLYSRFIEVKDTIDKTANYNEQLQQLKSLKEPIDAYFDQVMVMVDDEQLQKQRLGLMLLIAELFKQYAEFEKLVLA